MNPSQEATLVMSIETIAQTLVAIDVKLTQIVTGTTMLSHTNDHLQSIARTLATKH
jgi:hypothetical protein